MSLVDTITRVDAICKKYDKYDVDKQRDSAALSAADDPFARFYSEFESNVDAALQVSLSLSFSSELTVELLDHSSLDPLL